MSTSLEPDASAGLCFKRLAVSWGTLIRQNAVIDAQFQLRVTAASPGRVNFELDIKKEHTVSLLFLIYS
jgi:hypothetical protein